MALAPPQRGLDILANWLDYGAPTAVLMKGRWLRDTPASDSQQLDTVDPLSFAFRYPTNKKGEVSLPEIQHINVRHLSEIMESVFMLLGGIYS